MMTGHRTTLKAGKINYKVLRKINPEAARLAVIEYLKTNKGNISKAAWSEHLRLDTLSLTYHAFPRAILCQ
jgi:hypothetical protein